jgi:putative zinc finger protein
MTHLELENLVSDYLEGRLEAARQSQFQEHLAACERCQDAVAGVRRVLELSSRTEELEPPPWLVSKILLATLGERKPTLTEQIAAFLRPALQARVAYSVGMAVFSFSIIVNAAGLNLRHLRLEDLNPRTWVRRADRGGHLLYARAEKFCYDLRVVYEIESRIRQLRQQAAPEPGEPQKEAPKPQAPPGGSSDGGNSGNQEVAALGAFLKNASALAQAGWQPAPSPRSATP